MLNLTNYIHHQLQWQCSCYNDHHCDIYDIMKNSCTGPICEHNVDILVSKAPPARVWLISSWVSHSWQERKGKEKDIITRRALWQKNATQLHTDTHFSHLLNLINQVLRSLNCYTLQWNPQSCDTCLVCLHHLHTHSIHLKVAAYQKLEIPINHFKWFASNKMNVKFH